MRLAPLVLLSLVSAARADSPRAPTLTLTKLTHGDADIPTGFFSRDGKTFYVVINGILHRGAVDGDGTTAAIPVAEPPSDVVPRGVSPDGSKVAFGAADEIVIVELATGKASKQPAWRGGSTHTVEWLTDARLLSTSSGEWETMTGVTDLGAKVTQTLCMKLKVRSSLEGRAAPDGKHLALIVDGAVSWADVACGAAKKQPGWRGWVKRIEISPDGGWLAAHVDAGAGVGVQVQVAKVGTKPKVVTAGNGRMSGEPFWLTKDLLLFSDLGPFEASDTEHADHLMLYAVKTGAIDKVALPAGCTAYVLAVPAGGGHALLETSCNGTRTIGLLSAPVPAPRR